MTDQPKNSPVTVIWETTTVLESENAVHLQVRQDSYGHRMGGIRFGETKKWWDVNSGDAENLIQLLEKLDGWCQHGQGAP